MKNKQNGITLIALVITIIILLILAGVSISALTDSGLFEKAKLAKEKSENAQAEENETLKEYEDIMNGYLSGTGGSFSGGNTEKSEVEKSIEQGTILSATDNVQLTDSYGNKVVVPAGFKITTDATTVNKGIVIEDTAGNQFVWIPVGKVYTNVEKTEYRTITLERYDNDNVNETLTLFSSNKYIEEDSKDVTNLKNLGNTIAKDINAFKTSVASNGGYYIGRYEARTTTERSSADDTITSITENGSQYVYNYVTQVQAADLARNMYNNKPFISDLMNSYAWDTAILFLQECGDNSKYSVQNPVVNDWANTGTNSIETPDVQCNVYDMIGNAYEWTTETFLNERYGPCTDRGGVYNVLSSNAISRGFAGMLTHSTAWIGFRPILYL